VGSSDSEDVTEIVLERSDSPRAQVPPRPGRMRRNRLMAIVALAAAAVLGIVVAGSGNGTDEADRERPAEPDAASSERSTPDVGGSDPDEGAGALGGELVERPEQVVGSIPAASEVGDTRGVLVGEGAALLDGPIVVTPFPHPGSGVGSDVSIVDAAGLTTRSDVPLYAGDFSYPMLLVDDHVVFADLSSVWTMRLDGTAAPEIVTSASFVVPHGVPGRVWAIGARGASATELDLRGGLPSRTFTLEGWPVAGIGEGLLVDDDGWVLWHPELGARPLPQVPTEAAFIASSRQQFAVVYLTGRRARLAVVDPDADVPVIDVALRDLPPSGGGRRAINAAFSPEGDRLAVVAGSALTIYDLADGSLQSRVDGPVAPLQAPVWVGDRQVAFLATAGRNGTQELLVLDLDAAGPFPVVAELGPGGWWWARPS
jgi:hypothetical protein